MKKAIVMSKKALPLALLVLSGCAGSPLANMVAGGGAGAALAGGGGLGASPSASRVPASPMEAAFNKSKLIELKHNEVMPTEAQLAGSGPRVVVFETDDGGIELAKSNRTAQAVTSEIERLLAGTEVELVDRKLATKLGEELQLAEMRGNNEYQGEQIADYAILARLSHTGVTYEDASGACIYSAEVSGSARIYRIPAMRPVATETLQGFSKSQPTPRNAGGCANLPPQQAANWTRTAAVNGVQGLQARLHELFAPTGYVIEMRQLGRSPTRFLVKITLGTRHDLKMGDTVEITEVTRMTNPLTKKETIETSTLGTGKVIDFQLRSQSAWIEIAPQLQSKIRFGQPVRISLGK